MSDTSLIFNLIGKDFMSDVIGGVGKNFDKFALGIGGAGAAIGLGLVKLGSDFEEAYHKIERGTGATGDTLEGLKKSMKNVLSEVPANMDTVSTAITTLNQRTGATGPTLDKLGVQFVRLSQMSGTDVKTNIEAASGAFNKWGVATGDQSKQLDALFTIAQKTGVPIDQISTTMAAAGAPLREFGLGFQDSAIAIGGMQKAGVNVDSVMVAMKVGLANLSKAGKDPVTSFQELSAKIRGAGTDAEANAISMQVFGKKGGVELAAAMRSGAFGAADLKNSIGDTSGAIVKTAKGTDDLKEKLDILKNKGMVALEPIAMKVFEALIHVADGLKSATEWAGKHKDIMEPLGIALGVIAALFVTMKIGIAAYNLEQNIAGTITKVNTGLQWALNEAMDANPIGMIILIIGLLVVAFVLLWEKSAGFRDFWIGLWDSLKVAAEQGKQGFEAVVHGIVDAWHWVENAATDAKNWVIDRVAEWVGFVLSIPDRVYSGLQGMWQFFLDKTSEAKQWAIDRFSELLGWVSGLPGAVWDRLSSMWRTVSDGASDVKMWVIGHFVDLLNWVVGLPGAIGSRVAGMWDGIRDAFKSAINWIIDAWDGLHFHVPGVDILGQHLGDFDLGLGHINRLADGGITTTAGTVMVGERGPELLSLPQGAMVEPLPRTQGGGGVQKLEITHVIDVRGGDSEFRTFMQKLVKRTGGGSVEVAFGTSR